MEGRYNCCRAIQKALVSSSRVTSDPSLAVIAAKVNRCSLINSHISSVKHGFDILDLFGLSIKQLHEAVKVGPYLPRRLEAQPAVMTADRF